MGAGCEAEGRPFLLICRNRAAGYVVIPWNAPTSACGRYYQPPFSDTSFDDLRRYARNDALAGAARPTPSGALA